MSVAAVHDGGEQVAEQLDDLDGHTLGGQRVSVIRRGDRVEGDVAAGGRGDGGDRVSEGEQARAGDLICLVGVPLAGERGDRYVGDVVGVHERLADVTDGQEHLAVQYGLQQVVLAEVLVEPAAISAASTGGEAAAADGYPAACSTCDGLLIVVSFIGKWPGFFSAIWPKAPAQTTAFRLWMSARCSDRIGLVVGAVPLTWGDATQETVQSLASVWSACCTAARTSRRPDGAFSDSRSGLERLGRP
ncbi:hypothetical protein [Nonomuraea sp. NPDC050540]|uniref:hypothetical protein n=1 Tax=Nonomuraea sp. NPDC050540 TaxID=3364367 RepID=UPI003798C138